MMAPGAAGEAQRANGALLQGAGGRARSLVWRKALLRDCAASRGTTAKQDQVFGSLAFFFPYLGGSADVRWISRVHWW